VHVEMVQFLLKFVLKLRSMCTTISIDC